MIEISPRASHPPRVPDPSRQRFVTRIGRWSARHPVLAIAGWLCFVAVSLIGGSAVGTVKATTQDGLRGELAAAERIERAGAFPEPPVTESVLITSRTGTLDPTRARAAAADIATGMTALPAVARVADPIDASDHRAMLVEIELRRVHTGANAKAEDADEERVRPLLRVTAEVQDRYPDLRVEQLGSASLARALLDTLAADFRKAELISVPVALVILLLSFGAVIAAGVPVVLALSTVAGAMGLSQFASHVFPAGELVSSIILLIGMAVGVDYSLFYLRREREERAAGHDPRRAVEIAAATSGHAVLVSGIAVIVALGSLYLVGDQAFSSMATGSILVVGVAVLGSLTVLPALLVTLGRWIDRPRVPFLGRRMERVERSRFWHALLRPALAHPLITFSLSVGALVLLAIPALDMNLKRPTSADLPRSIPILRTYDRVMQVFPASELGTSHTIAVQTTPTSGTAVERQLDALATRIGDDDTFAQDRPPTIRASADRTVFLVTVHVVGATDGASAKESLRRLRAELLPDTVGTVAGTRWAVAGRTASDEDFRDRMRTALPAVMAFVFGMTFLVMLVTFRAPLVALTSIVLNTLSVAASYGVLVLVFQRTWAERFLGFTSNGGVVSWLPLMLFVILFGLSMDYHVFVVSRIREAVRGGMSTRQAIERGIVSSAATVSSAALIMVGVFSIFGGLSIVEFKQLGVGLAAAVLIDATIIRAVVLPSLMRLLGEANWWTPRFAVMSRPRAGSHRATWLDTPPIDRGQTTDPSFNLRGNSR